MQYRNKIIALFTAFCLLVGMMVIPSAAADDTQMYSYNGVVLSTFPDYDESEYPYAHVIQPPNWLVDGLSGSDYGDSYKVVVTKEPVVYGYSSGAVGYHLDNAYGNYQYYREAWLKVDGVLVETPEWKINSNTDSIDGYTSGSIGGVLVWSNYTVTSPDGLECPVPSVPIPIGGSSLPDDASILDVLLSIYDVDESILFMLNHCWLRLRYIEENTLSILNALSALAPSEQETALKDVTSDITTAYTETFFGEGSDNAIGDVSITESADILNGTKQLFNTGVSTSDFFGLFGDSSWGHWFSEETRADLHTVPSVSTLDLYDDEEKSAYEKNLDAIRDFMGG